MQNDRGRSFLIVLCVLATGLLALSIGSFAGAFFGAAVIAATLYPLHERLTRRVGGREYLSASVLTIGVVLSILLPVGLLSLFVVQEGQRVTQWLQRTVHEKGVDGFVEPLPEPLRAPAKRVLDLLPESALPATDAEIAKAASDLEEAKVAKAAADAKSDTPEPAEPDSSVLVGASSPSTPTSNVSGVASAAATALGRIGTWLAQAGVFTLAVFFLLAEGRALVDYLVDRAPLDEARSRVLLSSFRRVSVSVLLSVLVTGAAQTLVAAIGFVIADVPALSLVLVATFVFSFIPGVGGGGITVLAGVLVWASGRPGMGIFLIVWGVVAVGMIDNVIKPWVVKGRVELSGGVVFFAMICGLAAFGPLGLVAGPLVVAFFHVVTRMLRDEREQRPALVVSSDAPPPVRS